MIFTIPKGETKVKVPHKVIVLSTLLEINGLAYDNCAKVEYREGYLTIPNVLHADLTVTCRKPKIWEKFKS